MSIWMWGFWSGCQNGGFSVPLAEENAEKTLSSDRLEGFSWSREKINLPQAGERAGKTEKRVTVG